MLYLEHSLVLPTHNRASEAATIRGVICILNRSPRASHMQHLTLICTRVPPKRPQDRHTEWPASSNIKAPSNWLNKHMQQIQRVILPGTRPWWGEFLFAWWAPVQQFVHCTWSWSLQPASLRINANKPIAINTQLQQKDSTHTRNTPVAPSSGDEGVWATDSHRTSTIWGHPTKIGRHSRST